mmetsp:Transcript_28731/g.54425  ORF Transcript_28731/g.54425 Transcript_28731/m.54425 type:complete len:250 (-) Transcript_28731:2547-3296(-)
MGPAVAVFLQQRRGQRPHPGGGVGNRRVDILQHGAARRLDGLFQPVGLVDSDLIGTVGKDHDTHVIAVFHGPFGGNLGHGHRVGRDVGKDAAGCVTADLGARMPGDHGHARIDDAFQGGLLFDGVKAVDDDAIRFQRQRLTNRCGTALNGPGTVQHADLPTDGFCSLFDAGGHAQDTAVFQVTRHDDNRLALRCRRPRCRPVPIRRHCGHCDHHRRGHQSSHKCTFLHGFLPLHVFDPQRLSAPFFRCA